MKKELYRSSSLEKLASPDSLDDYIKIESPHMWLPLSAVFLIIAALIIWIGASRLKTTVDVTGIVHDGKIYAWLSPETAENISAGMSVEQKNRKIGSVSEISEEAVCRDEVKGEFISGYFKDTQLTEWNIAVVIDVDSTQTEGEMLSLQIVTEEINPLKFLLN